MMSAVIDKAISFVLHYFFCGRVTVLLLYCLSCDTLLNYNMNDR